MTIRKAEKKDIPQILQLLVQVNMIHHNGRPDIFKGPATKFNEQQLCDLLEDETRPVFVCAEADRVLGYAFCELRKTPDGPMLVGQSTLFVHDLCVDESVRGKGVGRALMEYVAALAKESGCRSVTLNVWACNEGARRFYEALGMRERLRVMELLI